MKENYVSGFFENSGENAVNYFLSLQENPLKLIPVILDIAIVIYVIVKIIKFNNIRLFSMVYHHRKY